MKKFLGIILAAMLLVTATATIAFADGISVVVNDQKVEFDVQPQIIEERTMVPLRAIFEALGATVDWDDATKTVSSELAGVKISLAIGSNQLYVNGTAKEIDVPAQIVEERTLVPVRAISEAFGCEVGWDDDTKTVSITMKAPEEKPAEIKEVEGAVITRADAEAGSEKYALFASSGKLETIADPDKEGNNIYRNTCVVTDKAVWTYVWYDTTFKPGQKYVVEYDCKVIGDALGNTVDSKCFIGTCFQYATATESTKDHAAGGANLDKGGVWGHVRLVYTVPSDAKTDSGRFGIYANPVDVAGYDYKIGLSYYIDNLSVLPYSGDAPDGALANDGTSDEVSEKFDFVNAKGISYNFDSDAEGWIAAGCTAEAKDGLLVLSPKEGNNDPQITLKDLSVDTTKYNKVIVRFKYANDTSTDRCNAFFATDAEPTLSEGKAKYVTYSSCKVDDEGYTWVLFDFSTNDLWKGIVNTIRFDPAHSSNGTYEIDKIVVVEK